jgi:septum formation protein
MFRTEKKLILASASPRRKALLSELGIDFAVAVPDVDESRQETEAPHAYVLRMASDKGERVARSHPAAWVLSADTIVILDEKLLMKPQSENEAVEMLMELSGREHQVRTGYCLRCLSEQIAVAESVLSQVRFKAFDPTWARAYAKTGEPMDKAGGYGIQDRGGVLVESISGSYSNVVGLPLAESVTLLLEYRVIAAVS